MLHQNNAFNERAKIDEQYFNKHFPQVLFRWFKEIGLIAKRKHIVTADNDCIELAIKEEIIRSNNHEFKGVQLTMTRTWLKQEMTNIDENHSKFSQHMVSTQAIYTFINRNIYMSALIDESGLDYIDNPHKEALLGSENFLSRDVTARYVSEILDILKKYSIVIKAPQLEKNSCTIC